MCICMYVYTYARGTRVVHWWRPSAMSIYRWRTVHGAENSSQKPFYDRIDEFRSKANGPINRTATFRVVSSGFDLFRVISRKNSLKDEYVRGGGGGRKEEEELIYTESRWRRQHYGDGISGNDVTQLRPFSVKIRRKERDATRSSACRSIVILDLIWKKRMVRPRETYERSRFNKTLRLSYIDTRLDGKDFITFIISLFI